MGLDSCMKCIKYTLFIFNLIFWIIGACVVGLGVYMCLSEVLKLNIVHELDIEHNRTVAISIIVIGSIIMLLGFFGCCGSILENKCMLIVFFILMTLVFLAASALGVLAVFSRKLLDDEVKEFAAKFENSTKTYHTNSTQRNFTDSIQKSFQCCGVRNKDDFGADVPESCKGHEYEGCKTKMEKYVQHLWLILLVVMFTTAFVTLIGMVLSMMLCCALRDEDYD